MPNDQFERIVRFAQRTGDRLIITDPNGKEPLVIMPLDEYESLVDGALGPGDYMMSSGEEDEYGDAPMLEIMEEMPTIPVPDLKDEASAAPTGASSSPSAVQKPQEPGEERFYLEPLG